MMLRRQRPRFDPRAPAHRARSITLHTLQRAHRARRELLLVVPLTALTIVAYLQRERLFGVDTPARVVAAVVLVALGWALARDVGRWVEPALFRRVDAGTAGTVSFLLRLSFLALAGLVALRIAGLDPRTLAVGGAITAVVLGLAAQQTLGNLIAGIMLIAARPFRIGDRVRLQGGGLAGQIEGTVASLGLLYVTFTRGEDSIMVPNNVVLTSAVVPLREPAAIDLRARLRPDVKPSEVQALLERGVKTPVRHEPHISLEEVDSDEVIVRIAATPESEADGPRLADEVLTAIASITREGDTDERMAARRDRDRDGDGDAAVVSDSDARIGADGADGDGAV
jgi:small conductance mechanosensitive channel